MRQRRKLLAAPCRIVPVQLGKNDAGTACTFRHDCSPGIDDQTMTESLPATGVLTDLGRCNDPRQVLNRAGTQQSVPVRLSRWDRKGRRNGEKFGTGIGKASIQFRKAKVITDRDSTQSGNVTKRWMRIPLKNRSPWPRCR